jgi:hypothetical protein
MNNCTIISEEQYCNSILQDNIYEYDNHKEYEYVMDICTIISKEKYYNTILQDNSQEYEYVYDKIKNGNSDYQILLKRIILYLINFESKTIIAKLRFFTELLLNENNINIFICISDKFDKNFYIHDYLDTNFRTPELDLYLKNRTELYNNKNFNLQFHIDPDLQWLYDNIIALNRWNNNTDELREDIKFINPPYLKSIINNLKTSYNYYLKKIEKENNKVNKRVIITYK